MINAKKFENWWYSSKTTSEIQVKFKFTSESAVRRYAKKLELLDKRDLNNPYNLKISNEIKKRYELGDSIAVISKDLGICRDAVHLRLIKLGIQRRRPNERNVLKKASIFLKSPYSNEKIIDYIKFNYPILTINKIANDMQCDRSTIGNRIDALKKERLRGMES